MVEHSSHPIPCHCCPRRRRDHADRRHGPRPCTACWQRPIAYCSCTAGRSSSLALESVPCAADSLSRCAQMLILVAQNPLTETAGLLRRGPREEYDFTLECLPDVTYGCRSAATA